MRKITLLALSLFMLGASNALAYDKSKNGITVSVNSSQENGVKKVRLEVMGEKIIRVEATPEAKFPTKPASLAVVPQNTKVKYKVTEDAQNVVVATSAIKAIVNKTTGEVTFTDLNGKVLLQEDQNGKQFTPYTATQTDGFGKQVTKSGWSYRTVFKSADDDAFYGLGQHQAGEMNYKGKNEELYQYNTKVSIPFIMSNKGYGLLWDTYSLARWGSPTDYQQLHRAFKLYDKEGKEGAITGTYIPLKPSEETIVRREDSLYYDNIFMQDKFPAGFQRAGSHVYFEGDIEAPRTATYRFLLYYAGYTKVYMDGKEVVPEIWRTAWNPNSHKFAFPMQAGKKVHLKIDWMPDGGESYCSLRAMAPVSEEEQNKLSFWSEMTPDMDYYFIAGDDMDEIIHGYRTLTGKAPVMPKWLMGFWQSKEKYASQDEIVGTLKQFRDRKLPIDNIVQDWFYWREDDWGSHDFDPKRFQDPQKMLDDIHAMHGRYMISCWPKFYKTTEHFKEFENKGWMYMQAVKDNIKDWVGQGYVGSFYDAYSADARKLFWGQMNEHLYTKYNYGVDAWWMDASEPNVRDCTPMEYRKSLCGPTAMGPSDEYFNAYALVNAMAIYDGQRSVQPNKRVFLLTRSGFSGLQRYSTATWSGDIGTRWEDLQQQITAGLNFCMAGIPFWSMDIGGFSVEKRYEAAQRFFEQTGLENQDMKEWRELNARWHQFGAFAPMYRVHGQYPAREIWNLAPAGHPCYETISWYTKLRYNLMPYLYSMAGWAHFKDYTLMRGLPMDFANDTAVNNLTDEYMFGPAFLVCPVTEYQARSREVYFPKTQGGWYCFYHGANIEGGQTKTVPAPYNQMPLFVRAGSIIPFGPDMQYTDEKQPENIKLFVYQGANGEFQLYEDEGVNYNYEKGKYTTIDFTYNEATKTLNIGARKGAYDGMLTTRTFTVIPVNKDNHQGYDLNAKGIEVTYDGKAQSIKL